MIKRIILMCIIIFITLNRSNASEISDIRYHYDDSDTIITPTNVFSFTVLNDKATIMGYTGSYVNIVIPYEFYNIPITAVGDDVFYDDDNIEVIVGSRNLTSIGDSFAYNCDILTRIELPQVASIGDSFAVQCYYLSSIELPQVTSIGDSFAGYCGHLIRVELPQAISIGDSFVSHCYYLLDVELPQTRSIGDSFAYNCDTMTNIRLSKATSIGDSFAGSCYYLTRVELPEIISIGNSFVSNCWDLTSIEFARTPPVLSDNIIPSPITNVITDPHVQGWGSEFGGQPVVFDPPQIFLDYQVDDMIVYGGITLGGIFRNTWPDLINNSFLDAFINTYTVRTNDIFTIERPDGFIEGVYTNALEYYIRIEIPLNPGGYPGTWTDYELKILFVTNSVESWPLNTLVYYYQTMGDPWDGVDNHQETLGDRDARVYYVDDYNASDVRKWMLYQNVTEGVIDIQSLALQFISLNTVVETVLHFPSHDGCSVPWETWQWKQNEHNLRAVFVRYNSLGPEMNHNSTLQKWNPVTIDWVPKRKSE